MMTVLLSSENGASNHCNDHSLADHALYMPASDYISIWPSICSIQNYLLVIILLHNANRTHISLCLFAP